MVVGYLYFLPNNMLNFENVFIKNFQWKILNPVTLFVSTFVPDSVSNLVKKKCIKLPGRNLVGRISLGPKNQECGGWSVEGGGWSMEGGG